MNQTITGEPGPDVVDLSGRPLLSDNGVDAVSAGLTALLTAVAALMLF